MIGTLDSSVLEKDSAQILFLFQQPRTFEADRRQTDRQTGQKQERQMGVCYVVFELHILRGGKFM